MSTRMMHPQIECDGLLIAPTRTNNDTLVYAELVPATPLLLWRGFGRRGWRRYWPLATGRTWKEPHIRWWYEVLETQTNIHHYDYDGGARTLREAIWKAQDAVQAAVDSIDATPNKGAKSHE